MSLADERQDYRKGSLTREGMLPDPIDQFNSWYKEASWQSGGRWRRFGITIYKAFRELFGGKPIDPNAMTIATVNAEGHPSARTVLLKEVDERGFVFFTNYQSRKARELEANAHAALVFYWSALERQVCVSGVVGKVPREESEAYFHSRPRSSQLGAWASDQSRSVASRKQLEESYKSIEKKYSGTSIPLPPHWGGYVLQPERVEFWQGRASRLHDRIQFQRSEDGDWKSERLNP